MKVLFVSGEFPPQPGGVGDYTDRLSGALADRGEEVVVLTSTPGTGETSNNDAVWATRDGATTYRTVRRWGVGAWREIARRIRAERPDVVHFQFQAGAYGLGGAVALYPWLLRSWNIRPLSVVTFHDTRTPHLFPGSGKLGLDAAAVRILARGADGAVATNAADAQALLSMGARRLWEAPIGPNIPVSGGPDARAKWRERLGVAPDAALIAYFGFLTASKGLEELVAAFAGLVTDYPTARLLFVGGGAVPGDAASADYAVRVREEARALGVADRLVATGFADATDVSGQLQAADVVALPYRDGASLRRGTLMAALSHGCAIVTTTPREPIPCLDGAVVCCSPGDPEALRSAIRSALRDRVALGQAAVVAAAQYSWPQIAAEHSVIYRALCRI